jgi:hypothetical protein
VVEEGDWINVVFRGFPLGDGFNVPTSDLLVRVQRSYPDAGPDMFWVEVPVVLANNQVPQSADSIESYVGRPWRRFSWHRQVWNASIDNLPGHLEFIRRRLREKK